VTTPEATSILQPPSFCQYAGGTCDQSFASLGSVAAFFLYPSQPEIIANTIDETIFRLKRTASGHNWLSWRELDITGQIIFCQICKAMRSAGVVVADVTTLNFNVLFEIGYAMGLGLPIIPIRDTTFIQDQRIFDELGLLDTLGYVDFENSDELGEKILKRLASKPLNFQPAPLNREQPLYLMKSHVHTDGMVKLMSALKKSGLWFRTFDPKETPRLSLHDAFKQTTASLGVVAHLVAPQRAGAIAHNSRCAFVSGLALASQKRVLMLQEAVVAQPIDYRDVVRSYSNSSQVPDLVIPLIAAVVEQLQESRFVPVSLPLRPLEKIDLGDLAAENEIKGLRLYFVATAEYNEAKRGHARLVVGRKGTGKTAIFYGIRNAYRLSHSHLVLDLKPEGHQFTKLRESINELSPGSQEHVLTAFWNYVLLMEIAHKIVHADKVFSYRDSSLRTAFLEVAQAYGTEAVTEQADFSERLLKLVDDVVSRKAGVAAILTTAEVTNLIYTKDIRVLSDALGKYLAKKDGVWLLFDNLDKGWPVFGAKAEDILILRSLLEASRKLERQLESRDVEFHAVVFIRSEIYERLIRETPDRGKDTAVLLEWDDPEAFREIVRRRIALNTEMESMTFAELWPIFFETHIRGEESFSYIISRTQMRPRDVIRFLRHCIDVAINRGHEIVTEADILQAEREFSNDAFQELVLELGDLDDYVSNLPFAFIGRAPYVSTDELRAIFESVGVPSEEMETAQDVLLWFGFLGIADSQRDDRYAYQFQHNLRRMRSGLQPSFGFVIHPGFRKALSCTV
jgi:hypothetical protein